MTTGVDTTVEYTTLEYNWDNMLRSGTKGTESLSLKYDPDGNRVKKQSGSNTRKYIVDIAGDSPTILLELDPEDEMRIKKTYIYATSQIIAQHDGDHTAGRYFYLHDRLGSVRQIIDTSANVKNHYTYKPFGELYPAPDSEETITNPFKFTGQFFDSEIDEYYLRARQYNPHINRFTTRDPVFGRFKDPLTLHVYLYCLNDPVNCTDPTGQFTLPEVKTTLTGWATMFGSSAYGFGHQIMAFAQRVYYAAMIRAGEISLLMHGMSSSSGGSSNLPITGYTRHGIESAISHDGVGVAPWAILETVLHPVKTIVQADGSIKYIGENAVVLLNQAGQVITTWALHSGAWRYNR